MALAKTVSAKSYQERLLHEGLPTTPEFMAEAKARAACGGVYAYILFLRNQPVSYVFCFCTNGIATYDYVGYDPAFASLSSGTVLQYAILQSLFNGNRVEIFDFTEGEGQHKSLFKTDEQRCAKTYFFRRGLKVLFLGLFALSPEQSRRVYRTAVGESGFESDNPTADPESSVRVVTPWRLRNQLRCMP